MAAETDPDLKLEIAHVLTIDVVAYSMLLIHEQSRTMAELTRIVRNTARFRAAEIEGTLTRLPTGDGMALVFFGDPEAPLECAMQISAELKSRPEIRLRMGIHSGPINQVRDVNDRSNLAGAGMDTAQRVMDCGDAGHILLSKRVADDLDPYSRWHPHLHELGECEVKHGRKLTVVNFFTDTLGNPEKPTRWKKAAAPAHSEAGSRRRIRPATAWTALLLALVLVGSLVAMWWARPLLAAERSVAVLPFQDRSETGDQEYLSDGITEQIINALAKIGGLRVPPSSAAFAFKNRPADSVTIGRQLRVGHILEGSVSRSGGTTQVITTLSEVASGFQVWAESYQSTDQDILSLQNEIAKKVAKALQVRLQPKERRQLGEPPTRDPVAYDLYLRGRYLLNRRTAESVEKARALFQQAVQADPDFALGHAGIADSYIYLGKIGAISGDEAAARARPEVTAALELDDQLADGYVARAILLNDFEWNWPEAEADYRKALSLDANNAAAHHWFARHQAQLGNFHEALKLIDRAQMLDPVAPLIRVTRAKILFMARRYGEAVTPCSEALELEPAFAAAFSTLGMARVQQGDHAGGIAAAEKYVEISEGSGWAQLELAYAYAVAGRRAESERIVADVEAASLPFSPYDRATIYAALRDTERAVEWLAKAIDQRSVDVVWIRVDPRLDNVRSEAAFQKVLNRLVPRSSGLAAD
ncbi:MAG: tetratricopeptide repeat protein [Chthoniobacterales bacterium]|nr:tetratricopeptide repeat protein [Chthoniobacterales bacterium]